MKMNEREQFIYLKSYDFASLIFSPQSAEEWPSFLPKDGYYGFFLLAKYSGILLSFRFNTSGMKKQYARYPELALSYLESGSFFSAKNSFSKNAPFTYQMILSLKEVLFSENKESTAFMQGLDILLTQIEKAKSSKDHLRSMDIFLAKKWSPVLRIALRLLTTASRDIALLDFQGDLTLARKRGIPQPYTLWLDATIQFRELTGKKDTGKVILLAEAWEGKCKIFPSYYNPHEFELLTLEYLYENKEFTIALEWLENLRLRDPENLLFIKWEIRFLRENFAFERARMLCKDMISLYPQDDELYCFLSNLSFLQGEYDDAREEGQNAVVLGSENPSNHVALAYAALYQDDLEVAISAFSTAITLDENNIDAYRGKAKALFFTGDIFPAITCLRSIFRKHPQSADLCYDLADMYFSCGYFKEAKRISFQCLRMDTSYLSAYILLGMLESRKENDEEAVQWFEKALSLEPDNPVVLNELAYIQHLNGNDDACMELLEKAVQEAPDFPDAICSLGIVYFYQSQFEEALKYFDRALALDPFHLGALVGKGNLYLSQSEPKEALIWFDRALEEDSFFPEALYGKVSAYRALGLEQEAFEWLEKIHESGYTGEPF